jgi:hypothetical protein
MESERGLAERLRKLALRSRAFKPVVLLLDGAVLRRQARSPAKVDICDEAAVRPPP